MGSRTHTDVPRPRLEVFTAAGCCLCDEARAVLEPIEREFDVEVVWTPIDGDPRLEAAWREQLPAGVLDGRKVFKYRVDEAMLRRRLPPRSAPGSEPLAGQPQTT